MHTTSDCRRPDLGPGPEHRAWPKHLPAHHHPLHHCHHHQRRHHHPHHQQQQHPNHQGRRSQQNQGSSSSSADGGTGRRSSRDHGFRHNPEVVMTSRWSIFALMALAMLSGTVTLVTLALAVSTDHWIYMKEPYRMSLDELRQFNITDFHKVETSVVLNLRSGLWNVCTFNLMQGNETIPDICLRIDFTQKGTGRMSGAPICMTIVGAIRIAAPLPVVALILAVSGTVMSGLGSLKRNSKTIVAAVFYILTGLTLAVGVVLFISAIYDELGYHSQTTGSSKEFSYFYGWSFYVAGSAFVSSEFSAVMCVTLYLRHNARVQDMVRIIPGLEDKLDELLDCEAEKAQPAYNEVTVW